MQSYRYEEKCMGVSERRQKQSSAILYRKMLIFQSSRLGIVIFLYEIKAQDASFILRSEDLNSDMQSQRYEGNCKRVSEKRQEQSCATLYKKMLISWSSSFGIQCFLYQIKVKDERFFFRSKDLNCDMQRQGYEENRKGV